ncbi:MAG: aspartate carbamoyltransferase regulatory subunit [Candidatus Kerfeldbacteria bacterium]|nr:aspartate carbamoyltransferase regulatory subunit [Candidatus Kerfeldbacteria bacterium]
MKAFKVYAIKNGTVIDHVPARKGIQIIERLKLLDHENIVTLGIGFSSKRMGSKDVVKIEDKELTSNEVNQVAMIAPEATLNIIRNYKLKKKIKIRIPKVLKSILRCPNPSCVTNHESVESRFLRVNGKDRPYTFKCVYCQHVFIRSELSFV